jgi:hypothetical protein
MTTSQRRITLLAGASISALGLSSPALADPWYPTPAPHDNVANGTYAGTNVVVAPGDGVDTIVICDIATDGDPAATSCFFGEKDEGAGPRGAFAANVITQDATGQTTPVDLEVLNAAGDVAEIGAVAISTDDDAQALLLGGIRQYATGDDDIVITLDNEGTLLINALAVSYATDADAVASQVSAVTQFGQSTGGDVTLNVINDGVMHIAATAVAFGDTQAAAYASQGRAIVQEARALGAGYATNNLVNNDTMHLGAYAFASAPNGYATAAANMKSGVEQHAYATGGGNAANNITNAGTMSIEAIATAIASTLANASASNANAIEQYATAVMRPTCCPTRAR